MSSKMPLKTVARPPAAAYLLTAAIRSENPCPHLEVLIPPASTQANG